MQLLFLRFLLLVTVLAHPQAQDLTETLAADCAQATSDYERHDLGCPLDDDGRAPVDRRRTASSGD